MPRKGEKKRSAPRRAYAQKAHRKDSSRRNPPLRYENQSHSILSMVEVARNTNRQSELTTNNLRHSRIKFVSATASNLDFMTEKLEQLQPTDKDDVQDHDVGNQEELLQRARFEIREGIITPYEQFRELGSESESGKGIKAVQTRSLEAPKHGISESSVLINKGKDECIDFAGVRSIQKSTSEAGSEDELSDSDEEVVLFKGRRGYAPRRAITGIAENVEEVESRVRAFELSEVPSRLVEPAESGRQPVDSKYAHQARSENTFGCLMEDETFPGGLAREKDIVDATNELESESEKSRASLDHVNVLTSANAVHFSDMSSLGGNLGDDMSYDEDEDNHISDGSMLSELKRGMTDEELARRLNKQEELGMDASEVLLLNGDDFKDFEIDSDDDDMRILRRQAKNLSRGRRKEADFARINDDIGLIGDDYGDFDVMDHERPSLSWGKGWNKREMPLQVSDAEIEANLLMSWQKDRTKKSQKKRERALLRAEGIQNGGKGDANLAQIYPRGMASGDIKLEIENFLSSDRPMVALVPMEKRIRRAIHDVANKFNLTSKSRGKGAQRYPCLFRTSTTIDFDESLVDSVLRRYSLEGSRRKYNSSSRNTTARNWDIIGASYRDGDTVGSGAPALGSENRGHAMLSKMGWTTGMALGATNNKGSLEPVAQVVKATKAGLG